MTKGGFDDWYASPSQEFIEEVKEYFAKRDISLNEKEIIKAYIISCVGQDRINDILIGVKNEN